MADKPGEYGRRIIKHYFQVCFEKTGTPWDSDYDAELDGAVDDIIAAGRAPSSDYR